MYIKLAQFQIKFSVPKTDNFRFLTMVELGPGLWGNIKGS